MKKRLKKLFFILLLVFCLRGLFHFFSRSLKKPQYITVSQGISLGKVENIQSYVDFLKKEGKEDPKAQYLYENKNKLPDKLLKLAAREKEARSFVVGYVTDDPAQAKRSKDFSIESPLIYYSQWDRDWGYRPFNGGIMATHGCGPTSIAMALKGLGVKVTPWDMAHYIEEKGYISDGYTSWEVFDGIQEDYPVQVESISIDNIPDYLNRGAYVVLSVRKGNFTDTSHMLVVAGVDEEGRLIINDPNSVRRSKLHWRLDRIRHEIKNAWAFYN